MTWQRYWSNVFDHVALDAETNRTAVGATLLSLFKSHVRVSGSTQDTELTRYLNTAARQWEDDTSRLLVQAAVVEYWDVWPWDHVDVVHPQLAPVVSVDSIKYYDTDNVLQTWSSGNYATDLIGEPARIVIAENALVTSPAVDYRPNAVQLNYTTGIAASAAAIEAETMNAIFVKAAQLHGPGRELILDGAPGLQVQAAQAVGRCWSAEIRRKIWRV